MGPWPPAMYRQHAPIDRQDTRLAGFNFHCAFCLVFCHCFVFFSTSALTLGSLTGVGADFTWLDFVRGDVCPASRATNLRRTKILRVMWMHSLYFFLIKLKIWSGVRKWNTANMHATTVATARLPPTSVVFDSPPATTTATPAYWAAPQQATSLLRQLQAEAPAIPSIQALTEAMGRPHGFPPPL